MVEINQTDLVFAFPDIDEEAILRIRFCPTDSPGERIRIIQAKEEAPLRLAAEGTFVMYLQPKYPFAVLLSVGGKNAITGMPSTTLERTPQNYFTCPPQGGIDGYF